jgi:DNA-binding transcriptional regulator LsrR (DeoR family)
MSDERERIIAKAIFLGMEIRSLRKRGSERSAERAELIRQLHVEHGMTQQAIATELCLSKPRIWEILHKGDLA